MPFRYFMESRDNETNHIAKFLANIIPSINSSYYETRLTQIYNYRNIVFRKIKSIWEVIWAVKGKGKTNNDHSLILSTKLNFGEFPPLVFKFLIKLIVYISPNSSVECLIYKVLCFFIQFCFKSSILSKAHIVNNCSYSIP